MPPVGGGDFIVTEHWYSAFHHDGTYDVAEPMLAVIQSGWSITWAIETWISPHWGYIS